MIVLYALLVLPLAVLSLGQTARTISAKRYYEADQRATESWWQSYYSKTHSTEGGTA